MERQLTREDILNAKAIHLYNEDTIYVELNDTEDVYGSYKGGEWFVKGNFWDYWDSSIMLSYFQYLTPDEAFKLLDKWQTERKLDIEANNYRLNKAITFATERHSGQVRKSTTIPYILHPLEVLQILYSMRADTDLLIAGVLHDTVEDTDTTLDEIREIFGDDVAELVASNSEDKSKTWDERKQHTITELAKADNRVKMLVLADKLSNIRSIVYDYKKSAMNCGKGLMLQRKNRHGIIAEYKIQYLICNSILIVQMHIGNLFVCIKMFLLNIIWTKLMSFYINKVMTELFMA